MLPLLVAVISLLAGAHRAHAQIPSCLHTQLETAGDRVRREQAMAFARRVHLAQQLAPRDRAPGSGRYRPLEELPGLPRVPDGFDLQFHTDGKSYVLTLKDRRDPCRFAVFSDQEGAVYAAVPQPSRATIQPLDTH